jgi:hypothetical protein
MKLVKEGSHLCTLLFAAQPATRGSCSLRIHSAKAPDDLADALPRESIPGGQL